MKTAHSAIALGLDTEKKIYTCNNGLAKKRGLRSERFKLTDA